MASKIMQSESTDVLNISQLAPAKGSRHRRKRLGIGEGSGNGKTCGKGQKGQTSRSGYSQKLGFEGGQMPLQRRLPKRGFVSRKRTMGTNVYDLVSIKSITELTVEGDLTIEALKSAGLVNRASQRVKILGGDVVSKKIVVEAHAISKSAKEAIEKAGGEVRLLTA